MIPNEQQDSSPKYSESSQRLMQHAHSKISVMMQNNLPCQSYDPFKCPPDLNEAILHGQARRVCKPTRYMKDGLKTDRLGSISQLSSLDVDRSFSGQNLNALKSPKQGKSNKKTNQNKQLEIQKNRPLCSNSLSFEKGSQTFEVNNNKLNCNEEFKDGQDNIKQGEIQVMEEKKCPCCGFLIENELIPINCNNIDFLHLGITYPLYFDFIKQCAILLMIHFFISSIPSIIINVTSNQCTQYEDSSFVCTLSFLNILQDDTGKVKIQKLNAENMCNCIFLLVSMIMISIFKIQQKIKKQKLEAFHCSISDFSIFITNLPKNFEMNELETFLHQKLKKQYQEYTDESQLDIIKSYKLFDLKQYATLYENKTKLNKKRIQLNTKLVLLKSQESKYDPKISLDSIDFSYKNQIKDPLIQDTSQVENISRIESKSNTSSRDDFKTKQIIAKYKSLIQKISEVQEQIKMKEQQLKKIDEDLLNFQELMINQHENTLNEEQNIKFSKRAIITFNSFEIAKKIRHSFKLTFKEKFFLYFRFLTPVKSKNTLEDFYFKDQFIKVRKAPEPTDILWTNIGSTRKKWKYLVASQLTVYLLLLVSFCVLLVLKKLIKKEQSTQPQIVSLLLSFTASTVVALFNSLLGIVIRKGATYEEHNVQTNFFVSVGKKITKMFIVNMVISTLMSNMVHYFISSRKEFPFDAQGLMNDFFFLFITNSYIGSIFNVFDIVWGVRLLQRYLAKKDCSTMTQMEANNLFEGHPIDMALRYANVNKTVLFTASVSPFIPIGVPLSILGLLITYWVDKYLLLRRYVCKNYLSYDLAKSMLNSFKIYAVFFSFGNTLTMFMPVSKSESNDKSLQHFIWPDRQKQVFFYISILGLLISLVFRYFPLKGLADLYNCVFQEKYRKRQIKTKYQEIKDDLLDDYDFYHPIFKDNSEINDNEQNRKESVHSKLSGRPKNISNISEFNQMFKSIQNQVDFHQNVQ